MEIGQKVNMLEMISEPQKKGSHYFAIFRCDCGNEKEIRTTHVTSGNTVSCGCYAIKRSTERLREGSKKIEGYLEWTDDHIKILVDLHKEKTCKEIGKILGRTTKSVQYKFNELGLKKHRAKVGDIVKGWEILEIYYVDAGQQKVAMARVKSTLGDNTEKEFRLTKLTLEQVGWPDKRRPDNTLRNTSHGETNSRLYRIWGGMVSRSTNEKSKPESYKHVSICEEWKIYLNFRNWAMSNGYSDLLTLDRIDYKGNYCPENCRWADKLTQIENRSCSINIDLTAWGETKSIYKWAHDPRCVVRISALRYRVRAGWDHESAISKQPERARRKDLKTWIKEHHPEIYEEWRISKE